MSLFQKGCDRAWDNADCMEIVTISRYIEMYPLRLRNDTFGGCGLRVYTRWCKEDARHDHGRSANPTKFGLFLNLAIVQTHFADRCWTPVTMEDFYRLSRFVIDFSKSQMARVTSLKMTVVDFTRIRAFPSGRRALEVGLTRQCRLALTEDKYNPTERDTNL